MFIPVAFIILVLAGLFIFMVLPQNHSDVTAKGGVLDLRGQRGQISPLRGEWGFVFGELLAPEDFRLRTPGFINVPDSWDVHGYPLMGYATYGLTILTDDTRPFTIFLAEAYSAYILWVNGEIAQTFGTVSQDPRYEHFLVGNTLITVVPENGVIELIFQVSNFNYLNAGLRNPIYFGESSLIHEWFFRTRLLYAMTLGFILMAAFYHVTLYIFHRHEKIYLFFSVVCFLAFARFFIGTNGLNGFFQWFPETGLLFRVFNALFVSHSLAIFAFSLYIFNSEFFRRHKYAVIKFFATLFVVHMAIPINVSLYASISTAMVLPVGIATVFLAARSTALKEEAMLRLYFVALIIFIVLGPVFLFLRAELFMAPLLNNMFFIMVQSFVLSQRYTDAFRIAEEKRAAERRLAAENAALENLSRMKTDFLQDIKHEVRNPLHVITLGTDFIAQCLGEQGMDQKAHNALNTIQQEAMRLGRMINGMVELATEGPTGGGNRQRLSLAQMLKDSAEASRLALEQKGNTLRIEIDDNLPDVYAEAEQLNRVPINLFSNAANSTENGEIILQASAGERFITVHLKDTGEGVAPGIMSVVFKRGISGKGGKGFGLAICKTIVEAHGGTIEIESEFNRGTTVTFTIPVYGGQSEVMESE